MARMFKVFQGNVEKIKSEMNEWLGASSQVQVRKMCMTSTSKGKFLSVLIFFITQGSDHPTQMVDVFQSFGSQVEEDMNKWCKERPKIHIIKMRMSDGGIGIEGKLLTVLVLYIQPEPEVC